MLPSTTDHPALALLPDTPTRAQIEAFGTFLQSLETPDNRVDLSTKRHTALGVEGRSVVIKAETFLVGLAHTQSGIAVCVGDITVWTANGKKRYTGAHIIETEAGHQAVGFAHSDTTWLTVHANLTGTLSPDTIENSLVLDAYKLMDRRWSKIPATSAPSFFL